MVANADALGDRSRLIQVPVVALPIIHNTGSEQVDIGKSNPIIYKPSWLESLVTLLQSSSMGK